MYEVRRYYTFGKEICFLRETLIKTAATGLGSGYAPFAPGTCGTLVGIPLYLMLSAAPYYLWLSLVIAFTLFSVYVSGEAEKIFGKKDPQRIVIDEIAGIQWTMLFIPPTVIHVIAGFALFRIFDILKPFPVNLCQNRLPGGWGVVGDDVAAGIYGLIILHIVAYYGFA